MAEYAVEYRVQIQPIEIFWVLLVEPQQGAGLIIEVHAVCGQHAAPLVRTGVRALSAISRKRKSRYSPLRTTASTSPPIRACHSSWVSGRLDAKGLRGSKNFSFQKSKSYLRFFGAEPLLLCSASASSAAAAALSALAASAAPSAKAAASSTSSASRSFMLSVSCAFSRRWSTRPV